jgi:hypothetical protein
MTTSSSGFALSDQALQIVDDPTALTTIVQTVGSSFTDPVALVKFPEEQTSSIRGYITTMKIARDLLTKKTSKAELFMADCIHRRPC